MTIKQQSTNSNSQQSLFSQELSLGMLFHEIRSPLTSILLTLSSLNENEFNPLVERQVSLAFEEAKRLRIILNDTLSLLGSSQLQFQTIEINHLISETIKLVQAYPSLHNRFIDFTPTQEPIFISGDFHKLQQVFINLFTNAAEAISPQEIITNWVDFDFRTNSVLIKINNSGNPIPSDVLSHLKDPFFTTKLNGTGLGLAIVEQIVRAHSGLLSIDSELNTGITVTVSLPLSSLN